MKTSVLKPAVAGVPVVDLVNVVSVLAGVCGVVLGAIVLIFGGRWLRNCAAERFRQGERVPLGGAIGLDPGGVR